MIKKIKKLLKPEQKKENFSSVYIPASFRRQNIIFIKIPKCAGTSISINLFGYGVSHKHLQLYWEKDPEFVQNAFKFSFVRHPYLRLWSAYNFLKRGGINKHDANIVQKNPDAFESFSSLIDALSHSESLKDWIHFRPQYQFLSIPREKKYSIYMDFVGKTENMKNDLDYLSQILPSELKDRLKLIIKEPINVAERKEIEVNKDLVKKVVDLYEYDFESFGYEAFNSVEKIKNLYSN